MFTINSQLAKKVYIICW